MRSEEIWSRGQAKRMRRELTRAETRLWAKLKRFRPQGYRFRRQHPIGSYIADFACLRAKLVIELDGDTHCSPEERAYDARRDKFLQSRGWRVLRFWNVDVSENIDGVTEAILAAASPEK